MPPPTNQSTFSDMIQQRCPRCRAGKVFRASVFRIYRWPRMYERCPVCDLTFERESGYFLGAMYISYGLGLVSIALIALLVWVATRWDIITVALWASILYLPLVWPITLFARVLWLYLDWAVDPETTK